MATLKAIGDPLSAMFCAELAPTSLLVQGVWVGTALAYYGGVLLTTTVRILLIMLLLQPQKVLKAVSK